MPFTPAHPALTYPARWIPKQYVSWTGLFIGSMVPDMEYFLFMSSAANVSHKLTGIFTFDLPVTFLMAFIWHGFLRKSMIDSMPFLKQQFRNEDDLDFQHWIRKNWLWFTLSALVGIAGHILWDGFCHAQGFMVQRMPYLVEKVHLFGTDIRRCYIFWYISSLAGIIFMLLWTVDFKSFRQKKTWTGLVKRIPFWMKVIVTAALIAVVRTAFGLSWNKIRHLVMIIIGSLFYSILITSWLEYRKARVAP